MTDFDDFVLYGCLFYETASFYRCVRFLHRGSYKELFDYANLVILRRQCISLWSFLMLAYSIMCIVYTCLCDLAAAMHIMVLANPRAADFPLGIGAGTRLHVGRRHGRVGSAATRTRERPRSLEAVDGPAPWGPESRSRSRSFEIK